MGGKREASPLTDFSFRPHAAAMKMDDPLDDGQPHPCPFELVAVVQPLEDVKHLVMVLHIETHPVVPHRVDALWILQMTPHFDQRLRLLPGEFCGIGDEVDEDLPDQSAVSRSGRYCSDRQPQAAIRVGGQDLLPNLSDHKVHVHVCDGKMGLAEARKSQNIVDEPAH